MLGRKVLHISYRSPSSTAHDAGGGLQRHETEVKDVIRTAGDGAGGVPAQVKTVVEFELELANYEPLPADPRQRALREGG